MVTSRIRADMLGRPENRDRVRGAIETVSGRALAVDFQAGEPAPAATEPETAGPRDDESLLEEFKTMFSAVEEGERPDQGGP
jgi:hypothetical protein